MQSIKNLFFLACSIFISLSGMEIETTVRTKANQDRIKINLENLNHLRNAINDTNYLEKLTFEQLEPVINNFRLMEKVLFVNILFSEKRRNRVINVMSLFNEIIAKIQEYQNENKKENKVVIGQFLIMAKAMVTLGHIKSLNQLLNENNKVFIINQNEIKDSIYLKDLEREKLLNYLSPSNSEEGADLKESEKKRKRENDESKRISVDNLLNNEFINETVLEQWKITKKIKVNNATIVNKNPLKIMQHSPNAFKQKIEMLCQDIQNDGNVLKNLTEPEIVDFETKYKKNTGNLSSVGKRKKFLKTFEHLEKLILNKLPTLEKNQKVVQELLAIVHYRIALLTDDDEKKVSYEESEFVKNSVILSSKQKNKFKNSIQTSKDKLTDRDFYLADK